MMFDGQMSDDGWKGNIRRELFMVETGSLRSGNAILQSVGDQQSSRSGKKGQPVHSDTEIDSGGMNTIVAV